MIRVGLIGLGGRGTGLLQLLQRRADIRLVAGLDPRPERARQRMRDRGIGDEAPIFTDMPSFLAAIETCDGIIIATRCDTHAPLAVQLIEAGVELPLLLEKPVGISHEQVAELAAAYRGHDERVVVSFPLRLTPLFEKVFEIVRSGRLGPINQIQAQNNVSYGGVYFGNWYRDFPTTGGLWLQKATHDFHYLNALVDQPPTAVAAMHSRTVFGGDKPEALRCSACDQTQQCVESPTNQARRGDTGGMPRDDHSCAFSESIRHQDAGSALLMYDGGIHVTYAQNFVTRRAARARGARITGHKATLSFDWARETLWLIDHHDPVESVVEMPVRCVGGHGGGDEALLDNFVQLIRGEAASRTPLREGLLSAAMCLAARASANTATFQPIAMPGAADGPVLERQPAAIPPVEAMPARVEA